MSARLSQTSGCVVKPCSSLEEVRACIDEIDDRIVDLIAARGAYVAQAARFKMSIDAVSAPDRVQQVLERVRARAHHAGLDPQIAEATYRAMMFSFIDWEAPQIETAP